MYSDEDSDLEDIGEYELDSFVVSDDESEEEWDSSDDDSEDDHPVEIVLDDEEDEEEAVGEADETANVVELSEPFNSQLSIEANYNHYAMPNSPNVEPNAKEPVASTSSLFPSTQVDLNASQTDDGSTCPICLDQWSNSDAHRLVSLKCGHLFGKSCVEKWLRDQQTSKRRCPQCNTSAKLADVRNIYAKRLKVADTKELNDIKQKYEKSEQLRLQIEEQLQEMEFRLVTTISENERLKEELMNRKPGPHRISVLIEQEKQRHKMREREPFVFVSEIEIHSGGECRVMAASDLFNRIVVSQPSTNPVLCRGFGLRVIKDYKPLDYIHLHQSRIRDVVSHPFDDLVLTVAEDKTVKITSMANKSEVAKIELECNAWSACYNQTDSRYFYVGLQNGNILEYDFRNYRSVRNIIDSSSLASHQKTPIVSLQYLDSDGVEGIVATHVSHCNFHSKVNTNYEAHRIPLNTCFTSSHVDKRTGHILLRSRPGKDDSHTTLSVLSISAIDNVLKPKIVRQFKISSKSAILSRSKIFEHPNDPESSLIFAEDDAPNGTLIFDVKGNSKIQALKNPLHIFDHSNMNPNNETILTTLTEKSLFVYKWNC